MSAIHFFLSYKTNMKSYHDKKITSSFCLSLSDCEIFLLIKKIHVAWKVIYPGAIQINFINLDG